MNNTQAMATDKSMEEQDMYHWEDYMYSDFGDDCAQDTYSTSVFEKTSKNTKLTSNEYNETKKMRDKSRKEARNSKRMNNWEGV